MEFKTKNAQLEEVAGRLTGPLVFTLLESTRDLILALDKDLRCIAFSRGYAQEFMRIFGRRLDPGLNLRQELPDLPGNLPEAMKSWSRALAGESFEVNQPFGGEDRHAQYEIRFDSIRDEGSRNRGFARQPNSASRGGTPAAGSHSQMHGRGHYHC